MNQTTDSTRYVQHRSGDGNVWKVLDDDVGRWHVIDMLHGVVPYWLPKSEYVPCEAPVLKRWTDVTSRCELDGLRIYIPGAHQREYIDTAVVFTGLDYRLRKVRTVEHSPSVAAASASGSAGS